MPRFLSGVLRALDPHSRMLRVLSWQALALAAAGLLGTARGQAAEPADALPGPDRVRLAEAFRLADAIGDRIWPGWSATAFAVLLVTPDHEYLLRHPSPPEGFRPLGEDASAAEVPAALRQADLSSERRIVFYA